MVRDFLLATAILIGVALLIVIVVGAFIAWKVARSDERSLARRIGKLRFRDKLAFGRDLMRDPRVPLWAKLVAGALVVYLASPIDLIPDFIPVLGQLDDLLFALIAGGLLLRFVPRHVIEKNLQACEARAEEKDKNSAPAV
jgi:uncharacterized membrane protein YkvA (DUF1232 family)